MHPILEAQQFQTRRQFFQGAGLKVGGMALAGLMGAQHASGADPMPCILRALPGLPHFPPKAKRLIYLHMNGAPSQLDLFDYKPGLRDLFDQDLPESVRNNQRITTMTSGQARLPVAPSMFKFKQCGESGIWMSELVPHMHEIADEIAMVKTVHTDAINHDPACTFVMTGSEVPGKPSLGSWLSYGLGSESNDLPAFVVFTPTFPKESQAQALFTRMWSSGFLPSKYDGVALRGTGDPVLYVRNPPGVLALRPPSDAGRSWANSISVTLNASAIRKRSRESANTKWRSACRPASRTHRPERRDQRDAGSVRPQRAEVGNVRVQRDPCTATD